MIHIRCSTQTRARGQRESEELGAHGKGREQHAGHGDIRVVWVWWLSEHELSALRQPAHVCYLAMAMRGRPRVQTYVGQHVSV